MRAYDEDKPRGVTREIWLWLAVRGGWWTSKQILEGISPEYDRYRAGSVLWTMAHRHGMLEVDGDKGEYRYSVTGDCVVPVGLRASEVRQALLQRVDFI